MKDATAEASKLVEDLLALCEPSSADAERLIEANPARVQANVTVSAKGREQLIKTLLPALVRLIESGDLTSNIYSAEYARELATKLVDAGIASLDHKPKWPPQPAHKKRSKFRHLHPDGSEIPAGDAKTYAGSRRAGLD